MVGLYFSFGIQDRDKAQGEHDYMCGNLVMRADQVSGYLSDEQDIVLDCFSRALDVCEPAMLKVSVEGGTSDLYFLIEESTEEGCVVRTYEEDGKGTAKICVYKHDDISQIIKEYVENDLKIHVPLFVRMSNEGEYYLLNENENRVYLECALEEDYKVPEYGSDYIVATYEVPEELSIARVAEGLPSCGNFTVADYMFMSDQPAPEDRVKLSCFVDALTACEPKTITYTIDGLESIFVVEGSENGGCKIGMSSSVPSFELSNVCVYPTEEIAIIFNLIAETGDLFDYIDFIFESNRYGAYFDTLSGEYVQMQCEGR